MNRKTLRYVILAVALTFCCQTALARQVGNANRQFYDSIFNAYHQRSRFGSNDSMDSDIRRMYRMARRDGNRNAQMLAMMDMAINEGRRGKMDTMFAYMERVHKMENKNTPFRVKAYENYCDGIVYYISHQYARSIEALELANQEFTSLEDSNMRAKTMVNISSIYSDQLMYIKAEHTLKEAIQLSKDDIKPITLLHLAGLKMKMGEAKEGRRILDESRQLMEKQGNSYGKIDCYTSNYWRYYHHLRYYNYRLSDELDSARLHVDRLMEVANRFGNYDDRANAHLLYAEICRVGNNYTEAVEICEKVVGSDSLTNDEIRLSAYKIMAPCLALMGRYKEAYEAEMTINQLSENSAVATSNDIVSAEMFNHYEMRISKMEEAQRERTIRSTAVASTAIVAALTCMFIMLVRRMTKRENEKNFGMAANGTGASGATQDSTPGWTAFERNLREDDRLLAEQLTRRCRDLNTTELKICILIRHGVDDQRCAETLNLSINSIKVYRSRLRKKLDPENTGTPLNDIIRQWKVRGGESGDSRKGQ